MERQRTDNDGRHALDNYINQFDRHGKLHRHLGEFANYHLDRDATDSRINEPTYKGKSPASVDLDGAHSVILDKVAEIRANEGDPSLLLRHLFGRINRVLASTPFMTTCQFEHLGRKATDADSLFHDLRSLAEVLERQREHLQSHLADSTRRDSQLAHLSRVLDGAAGFFAEVVGRSTGSLANLVHTVLDERRDAESVTLAPTRSLGIPVGDLLGHGDE